MGSALRHVGSKEAGHRVWGPGIRPPGSYGVATLRREARGRVLLFVAGSRVRAYPAWVGIRFRRLGKPNASGCSSSRNFLCVLEMPLLACHHWLTDGEEISQSRATAAIPPRRSMISESACLSMAAIIGKPIFASIGTPIFRLGRLT